MSTRDPTTGRFVKDMPPLIYFTRPISVDELCEMFPKSVHGLTKGDTITFEGRPKRKPWWAFWRKTPQPTPPKTFTVGWSSKSDSASFTRP